MATSDEGGTLARESIALGVPWWKRSRLWRLLSLLGPGLLITVGSIDPGNWATNMEAGSTYGYTLLWVITLSTAMLILLQHNAAHLGIASGYCLSEGIYRFMPRPVAWAALSTGMIAAASTCLAEVIGAGVALQILFGLPVPIGGLLAAIIAVVMVFTNSYKHIERWIAAFVALIGIGFLIEVALVETNWAAATVGAFTLTVPPQSMVIIMGVLGAVVMPHNLFLHSDIIQNQRVIAQGENAIRQRLRYEFVDTLFSMLIGWVINCSMIVVAAAVFFENNIRVNDLAQAEQLLIPLVGKGAGLVFAIALLLAGLASSVTAAMAGGTISSGFVGHQFNQRDPAGRIGILLVMGIAVVVTFLISNPFQALIISQTLLSVQLPITVACLLYLTSSQKVMGAHRNHGIEAILLYLVGAVIVVLNIFLLVQTFRSM